MKPKKTIPTCMPPHVMEIANPNNRCSCLFHGFTFLHWKYRTEIFCRPYGEIILMETLCCLKNLFIQRTVQKTSKHYIAKPLHGKPAAWKRHDTFKLLILFEGNTLGNLLHKGPVMENLHVCSDVSQNKLLIKSHERYLRHLDAHMTLL